LLLLLLIVALAVFCSTVFRIRISLTEVFWIFCSEIIIKKQKNKKKFDICGFCHRRRRHPLRASVFWETTEAGDAKWWTKRWRWTMKTLK